MEPKIELAALAGHGSSTHWAAILGTLLALGAVVATVLLLLLQQRQLKLQQAELREAQADRVREQASHVSAWVSGWSRNPSDIMNTVVDLRVVNTSGEPVYEVVVIVKDDWVADATYWTTSRKTVLPPGQPEWTPRLSVSLAPLDQDVSPPVEVRFTDAAGRHWRRTQEGRLEVLPKGVDRPAAEEPNSWPGSA